MTSAGTEHGARPRSDVLLILGFAAAALAFHLLVNAFGGYGIFRDEFYYIACSKRLAAGYVDQPPLAMFLLAASRAVFGVSQFGIRVLPAVAHALTVALGGPHRPAARRTADGRRPGLPGRPSGADHHRPHEHLPDERLRPALLGAGRLPPRPHRRPEPAGPLAPARGRHRLGPPQQDRFPLVRGRPGRGAPADGPAPSTWRRPGRTRPPGSPCSSSARTSFGTRPTAGPISSSSATPAPGSTPV